MKTKSLSKFQGRPLVEIPKVIPQADFLRGDFGKEVLREYNGRVQSDYQNNNYLRVLSYNDKLDEVQGSNPFSLVLLNPLI